MERLTFEGNFCDIALCLATECKEDGCSQKRVWDRLKEYEDTGLSPEMARELQADAAAMHFVLKKIKELCEKVLEGGKGDG